MDDSPLRRSYPSRDPSLERSAKEPRLHGTEMAFSSNMFISKGKEEASCFKCPICGAKLDESDANAHVNAHFPSEEVPAEVPTVQCEYEDCTLRIPLDEFDSHMLAHDLEGGNATVTSTSAINIAPPPSIERENSKMHSGRLAAIFSEKMKKNAFNVFVCSGCNHHSIQAFDRGWGCGYRNLQMLISSLLLVREYSMVFKDKKDPPSIPYLQRLIEEAWSNGVDLDGAEQLGNKVLGTKKWIGASDAAACLRYMRINAELYDFKQRGNTSVQTTLFMWIKNHFDSARRRLGINHIHPLFMQYKGHSVTVVGYEEKETKGNGGNSITLLVFDPSTTPNKVNDALERGNLRAFRREESSFKKPEFQILAVGGNRVMSDYEYEQSKVLNSTVVE